MLKVLDLCSGIGGFSLGLERTGGFETVAFCEIEPFPRKVLAKHWPDVPCFHDVKTLRGKDVGPIDVICGGYPCQPFSKVGKRRGLDDPRHLWPSFNRLISELRPSWFVGENVANHINVGIDQVLSGLAAQGYSTRVFIIPACGVDAPHKRERCWIIAARNDADCHGKRSHRAEIDKQRNYEPDDRKVSELGPFRSVLAGSKSASIGGSHNAGGLGFGAWEPEPQLGRMAHGVSSRVDRIRALGNAVVPFVAQAIGAAILVAQKEGE